MPKGIPQPCVSSACCCSLSKYPVLFGIWAIPNWPNNRIAVPSMQSLAFSPAIHQITHARSLLGPQLTLFYSELVTSVGLIFDLHTRFAEALLHDSIICRKPSHSQTVAPSLDIDRSRNLHFQDLPHSLLSSSRWVTSHQAAPCL